MMDVDVVRSRLKYNYKHSLRLLSRAFGAVLKLKIKVDKVTLSILYNGAIVELLNNV